MLPLGKLNASPRGGNSREAGMCEGRRHCGNINTPRVPCHSGRPFGLLERVEVGELRGRGGDGITVGEQLGRGVPTAFEELLPYAVTHL
jgi:hypothetical protein